jgi:hypothetical protein
VARHFENAFAVQTENHASHHWRPASDHTYFGTGSFEPEPLESLRTGLRSTIADAQLSDEPTCHAPPGNLGFVPLTDPSLIDLECTPPTDTASMESLGEDKVFVASMLPRGSTPRRKVAGRPCDEPGRETWICDHCQLPEDLTRSAVSTNSASKDRPCGHSLECRTALAEQSGVSAQTIQGVCRAPECPLQPHVRIGQQLTGPNQDAYKASLEHRLAAQVRRSSWLEEVQKGRHRARCSAPSCTWTGFMGSLSSSMRRGKLPDFLGHTHDCEKEVMRDQGLSDNKTIARWCARPGCQTGCPEGHAVSHAGRMKRQDSLYCTPPKRQQRRRRR